MSARRSPLRTAAATWRVLASLAYHFAAAAPVGDPARAVDYNVRAARAAQSALAFDEAVAHLCGPRSSSGSRTSDSAGDILYLELGSSVSPGRRLGGCARGVRRRRRRSRAHLDDAELLGHAAVGFENACWRPGITDRGAVELLEEAAAAARRRGLRAPRRILSGLSRALANRGNHERGDGRSNERNRDGAADRRPPRSRDGPHARILGARRRVSKTSSRCSTRRRPAQTSSTTSSYGRRRSSGAWRP